MKTEINRLFAGLTRKQKLALARRDAREIAYVFNDAQGHSMYGQSDRADLLIACDNYAKKCK